MPSLMTAPISSSRKQPPACVQCSWPLSTRRGTGGPERWSCMDHPAGRRTIFSVKSSEIWWK
ncbi:unnamed protein product [Gulo gulo]|uniref:Uncharacterized protein n=1 Tax=Gulo gulo TaxID=48420 RepID=A0A9X9PUR3_GULGU|nr:unnamed protein product [Gulo gulo]